MSGAEIAAEVSAALAEAGESTGQGRFVCTIKRPGAAAASPQAAETSGDGAPTFHEVTGIQTNRMIRDANGTLVGQTKTVLSIEATGTTPLKSDLIAPGVAEADVTADTVFHEIEEVVTVAPAGVPVLYKVRLAD